jgi:hypothetical protein
VIPSFNACHVQTLACAIPGRCSHGYAAADADSEMPMLEHAEARAARQLHDASSRSFIAGQTANGNSDHYVVVAVALSVVLFLAGISASLRRPRIRGAIVVLAVGICAVAAGYIATLPVKTP